MEEYSRLCIRVPIWVPHDVCVGPKDEPIKHKVTGPRHRLLGGSDHLVDVLYGAANQESVLHGGMDFNPPLSYIAASPPQHLGPVRLHRVI